MNLAITTSLWSKLPKMTQELEKRLDLAIRKTAFEVQREAQQRVPVDTGALKNSIYVNTSHSRQRTGSVGKTSASYEAASKAAYNAQHAALGMARVGIRGKRPPFRPMLPEVRAADRLSAVVAVGMEYGNHVEYGTKHMRARPYMRYAVLIARRGFNKAVEVAIREAHG